MKNLIVYTTKYGCTAEIARRLKDCLVGETVLVDLGRDPAPSLSGFDTVILGGSVYMGRVQKKLLRYMEDHLAELRQKRPGLFLSAGLPDESARQRELKAAFPPELAECAPACEILGSALNFDRMNFLDRAITQKMKGDAVSTETIEEEKIRRFADIVQQHTAKQAVHEEG